MRLVLMISKLRDYDEMIQHPEAIDEGDLLQGMFICEQTHVR